MAQHVVIKKIQSKEKEERITSYKSGQNFSCHVTSICLGWYKRHFRKLTIDQFDRWSLCPSHSLCLLQADWHI